MEKAQLQPDEVWYIGERYECDAENKKLIIFKNNGIIQKRLQRERGFVYETICYVCIARAIAIKTTDAVT
ncbi:MAG: hypothetical protein K2P44_12550 [Lachnospiraceae bacterium]|nr:hypothetical protein [Lachnospiraceae bacterium]